MKKKLCSASAVAGSVTKYFKYLTESDVISKINIEHESDGKNLEVKNLMLVCL
jgi:hypothetical protein